MAKEKQMEFDNEEMKKIATSPLGKACKAFVEAKEGIEEAKLELETIAKDVLEKMHGESRNTLKLAVGGKRFVFTVSEKKERLILKQESRTVGTKAA